MKHKRYIKCFQSLEFIVFICLRMVQLCRLIASLEKLISFLYSQVCLWDRCSTGLKINPMGRCFILLSVRILKYTHKGLRKKRWMMKISDCIELCSEQNNVRMNCRNRLIGVSIQSYSRNPSGKSRSRLVDTTSLQRLVIWLIKVYMCLYAQPMRFECAPNDTLDVLMTTTSPLL